MSQDGMPESSSWGPGARASRGLRGQRALEVETGPRRAAGSPLTAQGRGRSLLGLSSTRGPSPTASSCGAAT